MTQMLTAEDVLHWAALRLVPGLGARKCHRLLERYHTPRAIFRASASELEGAGLKGSVARSLASGCAFEEAVEQVELLQKCGAEPIPYPDERYPGLLRTIYDPPVVLFARGRLELLESLMIAVVGSRKSSPYGLAAAERLSAEMAAQGLTVVSGMARGIDTAAHRGALSAGGATVAVFGCGVDVLYPTENRRLAEEIAANGLLLSEFPMGTPAYPQNFPVRNRVVSGLSAGVVVVEGAQYSGSLITARLAAEQDREVYAVPGNITNAGSFGPNLLIKQGAHLVQDVADIIDNLPQDCRQRLARARKAQPEEESSRAAQTSFSLGPSDPIAAQLLSLLTFDTPTSKDDLVDQMQDCSTSELAAALFELETVGLVRQLPGASFVKVWYE